MQLVLLLWQCIFLLFLGSAYILVHIYKFFSLGVATFCRVNLVFSSDEVALPVSAEEGFTGVLKIFSDSGYRKSEYSPLVEGLGDFSTDELLKIDGEGRCIITDHEHFGK